MSLHTTRRARDRRNPVRGAVETLRRVHPAGLDDIIHLARLLDNRFVVPGTNFRFGLDALIGLIPGIGDGLSALISLYIIARAKHLGAPDGLLVRMVLNVVIDTAIGAFPILGDLFDAAYKSNLRNVRLLLRHLGIEEDVLAPPR